MMDREFAVKMTLLIPRVTMELGRRVCSLRASATFVRILFYANFVGSELDWGTGKRKGKAKALSTQLIPRAERSVRFP